MAHSKERLTKAGDYSLDVAELLSYKITSGGHPPHGENAPYRVDIKPIILQIELQESIFSQSMVGKIQVYDTKDVRTLLPIVGLERLNLKFHTPGLTGINAVANDGHPFHIYKIEAVAPDNKTVGAGAQIYDIYFCSRESYFNNMRKVSKAYTGQVEIGVEDIFKNKRYLSSKKDLYFEPTKKSNSRLVVPNVKPFQAIAMLAKKAVSEKYENAGYLFYETKEGYQFRSIESLLAVAGSIARPAKFKYVYQMSNVRHHTGGKQIVQDLHGVYSWNLVKPVDVLNNLNEGGYGSKLIEHDMFNKTISTTEYDYFKDFGNHFHTEHSDGGKTSVKTPLPQMIFDDTTKGLNQAFDQKVMVKSSTSNIYDQQDPVLANTLYTLDSISAKHTTQKAISQRVLLSNGILELKVPGNSVLQAGDIISFDMPLMQPVGANKAIESSPYWAGRYLIYDMKHIVNRIDDQYSIIIRCVKDTVPHPYVAEFNSWSHFAERKTHNLYKIDNELLGRIQTSGELDGNKLPNKGIHG